MERIRLAGTHLVMHILPPAKPGMPGPQNPTVDRLHQVAAKTEEIVSEPVECQKLLSLSR